MAFVSCSDRKFDSATNTPAEVGPGSYQTPPNKHIGYSCAPFLSTTTRPAISQVPKAIAPGPGEYEIHTNIVEPIIQAMANSRSIIVKINSTGTGPFKSLNDRFQVKEQEVPGPGSYNAVTLSAKKKRSNSGYHPQRVRVLSEKKKNPSIPHKGASLFIQDAQNSNKKKEVGPGAYQLSRPIGNPQKGAVWGKDAIQRFKRRQENDLTNVGPGKYYMKQSDPEYKANPSSTFASETVRTYFDKILYKTNQNLKAKLRMQAKYKSNQPGPGLYQPDAFEKNTSSHMFGVSERFLYEDNQSTPGPGLYKIKSPFQTTQRQSMHRSFDSKTSRQVLLFSSQKNIPGPGAYQEPPNNKFKYSYGTTSFINAVERFPQQIIEQEDDNSGPGAYFHQSKTVPVKKALSSFKSNTKRMWHNQPEGVAVGAYDLDQNDIASKIKKQKMFIDNLKKIEVQKAPFDSSYSRFKHYETVIKSQQTERPQNQFVPKKKVRTAAPSVSPRTEHPGFHTGQNRFSIAKKKSPSVGTYNIDKSWQCKSFNVKFSKRQQKQK